MFFMKQLVKYLLEGTRGGQTRARMLFELNKKPLNANQLSNILCLDYKTIQHHLRVLCENKLVTTLTAGKYAAAYALSPEMEQLFPELGGIWERFGKK